MSIENINRYLRTINEVLIPINIIMGIFIGIAHVYIPVPSLFGFILGSVLAICSAQVMMNSYNFTLNNSSKTADDRLFQNTRETNFFLASSVVSILLTVGSSFFGTYTGVVLVASALGLPFSSPVIGVMALLVAVPFSTSMFINTWLHAYDNWQELKRKVTVNSLPAEQPSSCKWLPSLESNKPKRSMELRDLNSCGHYAIRKMQARSTRFFQDVREDKCIARRRAPLSVLITPPKHHISKV